MIDPIFSAGQLADASKNFAADGLSDPGVVTGVHTDPAWEPAFKQVIHGCILITGDSEETVCERERQLDLILLDTIKHLERVKGAVRPGSQAGHEHFGFRDGLSQPPIIGFREPDAGEDPTRKIFFQIIIGCGRKVALIFCSNSAWHHSPWRDG